MLLLLLCLLGLPVTLCELRHSVKIVSNYFLANPTTFRSEKIIDSYPCLQIQIFLLFTIIQLQLSSGGLGLHSGSSCLLSLKLEYIFEKMLT
ncbi:hypothetical protein T09_9379 [Trichinella sp. T9]|nr:hypothetical protein T09_9379 [Trichinella sp. T9]